MKIAMVTDYGDITDQSFNQTTYQACKEYAEAAKLDFKYYKPSGDSTEARVSSINAAIQDGYNVVVLPGFAFAEAIFQTYPDLLTGLCLPNRYPLSYSFFTESSDSFLSG